MNTIGNSVTDLTNVRWVPDQPIQMPAASFTPEMQNHLVHTSLNGGESVYESLNRMRNDNVMNQVQSKMDEMNKTLSDYQQIISDPDIQNVMKQKIDGTWGKPQAIQQQAPVQQPVQQQQQDQATPPQPSSQDIDLSSLLGLTQVPQTQQAQPAQQQVQPPVGNVVSPQGVQPESQPTARDRDNPLEQLTQQVYSDLATAAQKRNLDPRELNTFLNNLTMDDMADLYMEVRNMQARQNAQRYTQPPVQPQAAPNLAEMPSTKNVQPGSGIMYNTPAKSYFD